LATAPPLTAHQAKMLRRLKTDLVRAVESNSAVSPSAA
jgi:hypothetical protein